METKIMYAVIINRFYSSCLKKNQTLNHVEEFGFIIEYKKGTRNKTANALSRIKIHEQRPIFQDI